MPVPACFRLIRTPMGSLVLRANFVFGIQLFVTKLRQHRKGIILRHRIQMIFVLLLSLCSFAYADEQTKSEKISQILDLMHFEETIDGYIKGCKNGYQSAYFSPNEILKKKGSYQSYTPQSKEWEAIQEQFQDYVTQNCKYQPYDRYRRVYEQFYNKYLTENDVDNLLFFVQSPIGQSISINNGKIAEEVANNQIQFALAKFEKENPDYTLPLQSATKNPVDIYSSVLLQLGILGLIVFFIVSWVMMFYKLYIQKKK
jgi:hypothetical protein